MANQDNELQLSQILNKLADLMEEDNRQTSQLVKMAGERNEMADLLTSDSQKRTDYSKERTELTREQASLSTRSTELAKERNDMADTRTGLASYRSVLAEIRTELAFIRTGLAFIVLGIGMMRYFGLGSWTMLDAGLMAIGVVMTLYGVRSFILTRKNEKRFAGRLRGFLTLDSELEPMRETN